MNPIKDLTTEDLCRIYHKCNVWEWPSELGEKPKGNDKLPNFPNWFQDLFHITTKHDYVHPIMMSIEKLVSEKELLRYHHIHNLKCTNDEFEMWWFLTEGGAFSGKLKVVEYFSKLLE